MLKAWIFFLFSYEALAYSGMGSISRSSAQEEMKNYTAVSLRYLKASPLGPLEMLGHRAGSFEEYPLAFAPQEHFQDVAVLMDRSFHELKLSAIEIDIRQTSVQGRPLVYVAHDQVTPPFSRPTMEALERNSLRRVLSHYLARGYQHQGKKIFIEIKTEARPYWRSHPAIIASERLLIARAIEEIKNLIHSHPERQKLEKLFNFAGFNFFALEYQATLAPEFSSYWIATSNGGVELSLLSLLGLGGLNSFMREHLAQASWLDGVWFDPFWIERYPRVFNQINEKRASPLEFYLSTYGFNDSIYAYKLWKNHFSGELDHFRGLIFDISKN